MQNRPVCFVQNLRCAHVFIRDGRVTRSHSLPSRGAPLDSAYAPGSYTDRDTSRARRKSEPIVVSATRFDIPLDQSPASVSVITSRRYRAKTNPARERCASRSAWAVRGADWNAPAS